MIECTSIRRGFSWRNVRTRRRSRVRRNRRSIFAVPPLSRRLRPLPGNDWSTSSRAISMSARIRMAMSKQFHVLSYTKNSHRNTDIRATISTVNKKVNMQFAASRMLCTCSESEPREDRLERIWVSTPISTELMMIRQDIPMVNLRLFTNRAKGPSREARGRMEPTERVLVTTSSNCSFSFFDAERLILAAASLPGEASRPVPALQTQSSS
mmetsp:Transcript_72545/g.194721  ORF Transcript_72545/g.194721 Transcript_72545/m.194721 type:complete len:211 (+) Transcript_72545:329-961(+)